MESKPGSEIFKEAYAGKGLQNLVSSSSSAENETTEEFGNRFAAMTRHSFDVLCVALGSRVGLFDVLARLSDTGPHTTKQIAKEAGCKERYIKEWLGAMVCAKIVNLDKSGDEDRFYLDKAKIPVLTGAGSAANWSWCLPIMAAANEEMVSCFKANGPAGVPYSSYPYFHEWREEWLKGTLPEEVIQKLLSSIPGVKEKLESGIEVLGLASSSGTFELRMAKLYPNSTFIGLDINAPAIETANKKAAEEKRTNITFVVQDIYAMPEAWSEKFDLLIGVDFLHDLPHPVEGLKALKTVMKPGAILSVSDVPMHTKLRDNTEDPLSSMVYAISLFHCMPVSLHAQGEGPGAAWGMEQERETFQKAGFHEIYQPSPEHFYTIKN